MGTITLKQVIDTTAQVVEDIGPDTRWNQRALEMGGTETYPGSRRVPCKYVIKNQPACIAGVVMARLGVPIATLLAWDEADDGSFHLVARGSGGTNYDDDGEPLPERKEVPSVKIEDDAVKFMRIAQRCQDNGLAWGEALTTATERAPAIPFDHLY